MSVLNEPWNLFDHKLYSERDFYPLNLWKKTVLPVYKIFDDKIEVELAGFAKDEVKVRRNKDLVMVSAKKDETEKSVTFKLPNDVRVTKVTMKNGLLQLTLSPDEKDTEEYSVE